MIESVIIRECLVAKIYHGFDSSQSLNRYGVPVEELCVRNLNRYSRRYIVSRNIRLVRFLVACLCWSRKQDCLLRDCEGSILSGQSEVTDQGRGGNS